MAGKRVLIIDDCQTPSLIEEHSWTDLINDDDDIELYIFTSTGALSEKDKTSSHVRAYKEIASPVSDATLELWAYEMHKKHSFTHVYTKHEDLMMRTAHIRNLLNLKTGLTAELIPGYREKVCMKELASKGGFPVPPFARLYAPADLIRFIEKQGYPVVVKPTLGAATSGIHLIKDEIELEKYLSKTLFESIDINQRLDLVGELTVEGFMHGCIYHVNGIARNGQVIRAWPFTYLHTCLDFSQGGHAYGNSSIPRSDPRHDRLCKAAQRLLDTLPAPSDGLVFHIEFYENLDENRLPEDDFVLCEIGARAPGATITYLMDLLSFQKYEHDTFARLDFRISLSLPIPPIPKEDDEEEIVVTDLILPRKPGTLTFLPRECPIENLTYVPLVDLEKSSVYKTFDVNGMNSVCRFLARTKTMEEGRALVEKGFDWFETTHINTPPDEPYITTIIKELQRFFHKKFFV